MHGLGYQLSQMVFYSLVLITGGIICRTFIVFLESREPLTPNCLLTKKTIGLIIDPQPFWKFWSPEQKAFRYLKRHGYQCQLIFNPRAKANMAYLHPIDISNGRPINNKQLLIMAIHFAEEDFV